MTDPQSLSAERREEVLALWEKHFGQTGCFLNDEPITWQFLSAIDAQHAERTRAEVEKMREALKIVRQWVHAEIDWEYSGNDQDEWEVSARDVPDRIDAALSIEGKPTHLHIKSGHKVSVVAQGRMQTASPIGDMTEVTIYQHEGRWWVRPTAEFNDGRFRALSIEGTGQ